MDFLGDLLDFGDRNNRRGGRHGHDDDDDEHYDHKAPGQRYDEHSSVTKTTSCVSCSTGLLPHFNFCPQCGTAVPRAKKCTGCKGDVAPGAKFCPSCGTKT